MLLRKFQQVIFFAKIIFLSTEFVVEFMTLHFVSKDKCDQTLSFPELFGENGTIPDRTPNNIHDLPPNCKCNQRRLKNRCITILGPDSKKRCKNAGN